MSIFFAFLSAGFAALVAIFAKLGLQNIDSTLATTVRALIMALFFVLVSLFFGKFTDFNFSSFNTREWILIVLSGLAGALSWLFYFYAIQNGSVTTVVAIDKLSIAFVVVLAVLLLGENLSWKVALGALLMTGGAVLISWKG